MEEKLKVIANAIEEVEGCKALIESAIDDLNSAVETLLQDVTPHDVLHGNDRFVAASIIHGIMDKLRQIS